MFIAIIQLIRESVTVKPDSPAKGSYPIDWKDSTIEMNFFIPTTAETYDIVVSSKGANYTITSPEHQQKYLSWNKLYEIHTLPCLR